MIRVSLLCVCGERQTPGVAAAATEPRSNKVVSHPLPWAFMAAIVSLKAQPLAIALRRLPSGDVEGCALPAWARLEFDHDACAPDEFARTKIREPVTRAAVAGTRIGASAHTTRGRAVVAAGGCAAVTA